MVFIGNGKLHVSAYSGHHITVIERKLSKPVFARYRPKHVAFYCYLTQSFSHIFIVVFDRIYITL